MNQDLVPQKIYFHRSGTYEIQMEDLWDIETQNFILSLDSRQPISIFFTGQEKQYPGILISLKQRFDNIFFVLRLQRGLNIKNLRTLAPQWLLQNLFFCPDQYRLEDPRTLSTTELFKLITQLNEAGIQGKILPYRDYELQKNHSQGVLQWHTLACEKSSPQISIIIPTRNYGHFVVNSLRHLCDQSLGKNEYEVILVDDQSQDSTFQWVKAFVAPQSLQFQFKYISHQNSQRGSEAFCAGICRNLGLQQARGRIILFLDSDMLVPHDYLEGLLKEMEIHDVIQSPRFHIRPDKSSQWTEVSKLSAKDLYIEEKDYWQPFFESSSWDQISHFWRYTCTYTLAVKRQDLEEVGAFREVFQSYGFEDTELGYRLAKAKKKFYLWKKNVFHLTPPRFKARYAHSIAIKHVLLSKTAKVFFLSTLDLEVFSLFRPYMGGEGHWRQKWHARFNKAASARQDS